MRPGIDTRAERLACEIANAAYALARTAVPDLTRPLTERAPEDELSTLILDLEELARTVKRRVRAEMRATDPADCDRQRLQFVS